MPRRSRIDALGALHHIIVRGIERAKIFRNEYDRDDFLGRLGKVLLETETACAAWALLDNHFHLLLKTGRVPIATVMRRILTGYAGSFNLRHRRSGHLFQNRYKSILCQEDTYYLELIRYIHLNPIRAGLIDDLRALDDYPYAGHSAIMGKVRRDWQDVESVLIRFSQHSGHARRGYRAFVEQGIAHGHRPDLIGGGLIRSRGGWTEVTAARKSKLFQKSDERILGDGDFVEKVLAEAEEQRESKHQLAAQGYDLDKIASRVAECIMVDPSEIWAGGKERKRVRARSLLCYWAVQELGMSMAELSRTLRLSSSGVSLSVKRGAQLVKEERLVLLNGKTANVRGVPKTG
jgi:REP element-mobilizing transposase RayT/lambda repressor-like predicted transcriptional regulator